MAESANSRRATFPDRRCSERFGLEQGPFLILSVEGEKHCCRLANISFGGLQVHFEETAPLCEAVVLEHDFVGRLNGTRSWLAENAMGVELKIPERDLEHALKCVGLLIAADENPPSK